MRAKKLLTMKNAMKYNTKNEVRKKGDVIKFFEQDDVSRVEPGIKDTKTKNKIKKQKRTLMGSLKNLHKKFEAEFGYSVPYSTFCSFRPFWVLLPNVKNRDTCACEKHENIGLIFEKLKSVKVLKYTDLDEMVKSLCCNLNELKTREECLERRCPNCLNKSIEIDEFENSMTSVEQWKRKNVEYTVKGTKKFAKKVVKETVDIEVKALFEKLYDMVPSFMQHVCNIMHQYKSIKDQKKSMKSNELLIHVTLVKIMNVNTQKKYNVFILAGHANK